jgi:transcriptional regulator with XRE-family HTH domain
LNEGVYFEPIGCYLQQAGLYKSGRVFHTTRMSKSLSEKAAFTERLKLALTRSQKKIETATELALQFNLRHPNDPVTNQAVQKWLTGKACPTSDKIETLADWLGVSAHWLRFGAPTEVKRKRALGKRKILVEEETAALSSEESRLMARYRQLSPHQQNLVAELVAQLTLDKVIQYDAM